MSFELVNPRFANSKLNHFYDSSLSEVAKAAFKGIALRTFEPKKKFRLLYTVKDHRGKLFNFEGIRSTKGKKTKLTISKFTIKEDPQTVTFILPGGKATVKKKKKIIAKKKKKKVEESSESTKSSESSSDGSSTTETYKRRREIYKLKRERRRRERALIDPFYYDPLYYNDPLLMSTLALNPSFGFTSPPATLVSSAQTASSAPPTAPVIGSYGGF